MGVHPWAPRTRLMDGVMLSTSPIPIYQTEGPIPYNVLKRSCVGFVRANFWCVGFVHANFSLVPYTTTAFVL